MRSHRPQLRSDVSLGQSIRRLPMKQPITTKVPTYTFVQSPAPVPVAPVTMASLPLPRTIVRRQNRDRG